MLQARYDSNNCQPAEDAAQQDTVFQNVVITDVDGHASMNQLRAAAVRHFKADGGYMSIPHGHNPVNEYQNPVLFPMMYPTLYPYGLGGMEDPKRKRPVSLKAHVTHLFSLADRRFQEHHSFMFIAFNILQRRALLLHTSLKVKRSDFAGVASKFAHVSLAAVQAVTDRATRGDIVTARDDEERQVLQLMKEVNVITAQVPGSAPSKVTMRNEMRGLMMHLGLPSFFLTINPADVYNPVVKFLAGNEIDVDHMDETEIPTYWEQSLLVAKNPIVAAKFFHTYMTAFFQTLLGFCGHGKNMDGGILGLCKGYYGVVEAQGRGTLHCHMMIWLEGALNPNEIKERVTNNPGSDFQQRLVAFLDDTISNAVPPAPESMTAVPSSQFRAASVRGLNGMLQPTEEDEAMDFHNIVEQCQVHSHSKTCYKYSKDQCRFDLDPSNFIPITTIDPETGVVTLRCLDGLVNNFNATIIQAMRCNMDIQFIGSGTCAKAVLYYITNYISKSQLKSHVAFAALELAVSKLGEELPGDNLKTVRAKQMLQKCAHAMISHQELSAQQVASYLMGYGDHFTSHTYRKFHWTLFEAYVDGLSPSPECYRSKPEMGSGGAAETSLSEEDPIDNASAIALDKADDSSSELDDEPDEDEERQRDDNEEPGEDTVDVDAVTGEETEVRIDIDDDGLLTRRSSLVADYVQRGVMFQHLSLWDFMAQVDKIKKRTHDKDTAEDEIMEEDIHAGEDIAPGDDHDPVRTEEQLFSARELLMDTSRTRPKSDFGCGHENAATHHQIIRQPLQRHVVVPIGSSSLPRRDKHETKCRYHRLMLIFFHPWRHATDLRRPEEDWGTAFERLLGANTGEPRVREIMDNMQILHECKDERDEHYANRMTRGKGFRVRQEFIGTRNTVDDFMGEAVDDVDVMKHIDSVEECLSNRAEHNLQDVTDCLLQAQHGGLFSPGKRDKIGNESDAKMQEVKEGDDDVEDSWREAYVTRRKEFKKQAKEGARAPEATGVANNPMRATIESLSAANTDHSRNASLLPQIMETQGSQSAPDHIDTTIEKLVKKWTMNAEQALAFRIIAQQSANKVDCTTSEPLRMFLGGPAGTGKSRVLNALRDFFDTQNQSRRLRVCSFMGIAARNVSGMTLHAALCMGHASRNTTNANNKDLIALWEGVDFLFVDEVSMIGCKLFSKLSEALSRAKGNVGIFGGINVIFAGDFAQLPPVGEQRLYANLRTRGRRAAAQDAMTGRLLWLSVRTVVCLHQQHRQAGERNAGFVELLQRLREGRCTPDDVAMLKTRIMSPKTFNRNASGWLDAPVIVSSNATRDAINERAAIQFAKETGQDLHYYYATDRRGRQKTPVADEALVKKLRGISCVKTGYRLGKIPLVVGMPVLVAQNFDVNGGVVNGSRGTIRSIRYTVDARGDRHLQSCVVHIPDATAEHMPGLMQNEMPILADSVSFQLKHPYNNNTCTFHRTQVPIVPAFAMTAHRAQGQTMERVIIDLAACRGTEAPYVMASRATSLDGLVILRDFEARRVQVPLSQDSRDEKRRIEVLRLRTLVARGKTDDASEAARMLRDMSECDDVEKDEDAPHLEHGENPRKLLERLQRRGAGKASAPPPPAIVSAPRIKKRARDTSTVASAPTVLAEHMDANRVRKKKILGPASSSSFPERGDQSQAPGARKRRRVTAVGPVAASIGPEQSTPSTKHKARALDGSLDPLEHEQRRRRPRRLPRDAGVSNVRGS